MQAVYPGVPPLDFNLEPTRSLVAVFHGVPVDFNLGQREQLHLLEVVEGRPGWNWAP